MHVSQIEIILCCLLLIVVLVGGPLIGLYYEHRDRKKQQSECQHKWGPWKPRDNGMGRERQCRICSKWHSV